MRFKAPILTIQLQILVRGQKLQLKSIASCFKAHHLNKHCNCYLPALAAKIADKKIKIQTFKNSLPFFPLIACLLWNHLHFIVCLVTRKILCNSFATKMISFWNITMKPYVFTKKIGTNDWLASGAQWTKEEDIKEVIRNHIFLSSLSRSTNTPNDWMFLWKWIFQLVL